MLEALVFHPFWCLGAQRKGMVIRMKKRVLSEKWIERYIAQLRSEEKADATLEKYRRDIYAFFSFLPPGR